MTDLVSVVIPVYNTNERFKACFESVLKQKYQNIEVILVDDGSFDTSAKICDTIALSTSIFPVYVIHKHNGGVSSARNLGINFANGKYLVFIDSDDKVTPDYISDFIAAREKYPEVGHIWCGFEYLLDSPTRYQYTENEPVSVVNRNDYLSLYDKVLSQGPCMKLYKTDVLRNNEIKMDENLDLAEDIIFNLEYLDAETSHEICIINNTNYFYLDNSRESLRNRYRENLIEIYDYYLELLWKYLKKWCITDSKSVSVYYSIVYYEYVAAMNNTFSNDNTMSFCHKLSINNDILCKRSFTNALLKMNLSIPFILRKAYQTKHYFWVWLYKRIVEFVSSDAG